MGVLTAEQLRNLGGYSYSSVDKSWVSARLMQPFWSRVVLLIPLWVAPNLLTLIGLGFVAGNVALVSLYSPDLGSPCPPWVCLSVAAGIFVYQTLDAVDGKQARRTNTCGPLGELFDHVCDSLNVGLLMILMAPVLGLAGRGGFLAGLLASMASFYTSTWEHYHTGTLYLGHVSGPVEGLLAMSLVCVGSAVWGQGMWQEWVFWVMAVLFGMMVVTTVAQGAWNVYRGGKHGRSEALWSFLHIWPFLTLAGIWACLEPALIKQLSIPFCLAVGFGFSGIVGRLAVAHVTLTHPRFRILPVAILAKGVALSALAHHLRTEGVAALLIYLSLAILAADYLYYTVSVAREISHHLGIGCFTIKKRQ